MEYLKFFDIEDNYLAYRDNKNKYVKPNVSFVYDNKEVYYNYTPAPQVTYDYSLQRRILQSQYSFLQQVML